MVNPQSRSRTFCKGVLFSLLVGIAFTSLGSQLEASIESGDVVFSSSFESDFLQIFSQRSIDQHAKALIVGRSSGDSKLTNLSITQASGQLVEVDVIGTGVAVLGTFDQPGTYTFEATATFETGESDLVNLTIQVGAPTKLPIFTVDELAMEDIVGGGHVLAARLVLDLNNDQLDDFVWVQAGFENGQLVNTAADIVIHISTGTNLIDQTTTIIDGPVPSFVSTRRLLTADFNRDDLTDLYFANEGFDAEPFPGEADGLAISNLDGQLNLATENLSFPMTGFSHGAAVGDLDGDGDADIVNNDNGSVDTFRHNYILENDGTGQFTVHADWTPDSVEDYCEDCSIDNQWLSMELSDLNRDGRPELILGGVGWPAVALLNPGNGNFRDSAVPPVTLPSPVTPPEWLNLVLVTDVTAADIDGDGVAEIFVSFVPLSGTGSFIQVLAVTNGTDFHDITGAILPSQDTNDSGIYKLFPVDIDSDGDVDLVADRSHDFTNPEHSSESQQQIWINQGAGSFEPFESNLFPSPGEFNPMDIDGDGDQDILSFRIFDFGHPNQIIDWTLYKNVGDIRPEANLIASYELNGSYADVLGGPAITPNGGQLDDFGYSFEVNQGLSLSGVIAELDYSIEMMFQVEDPSSGGTAKIIDFANLSSDLGFYTGDTSPNNGFLGFFSFENEGFILGNEVVFTPNTPVHIVVTRDGFTKEVIAYANGIEQLSFIDHTNEAIFSAPANTVNFLIDDGGGTEASGGFVDYIQIYDRALTEAEVMERGNP